MSGGGPLLQARDLVVRFRVGAGRELTAVDRVSLHIDQGEVVAVVGESGSGKTTVAKVLSQLQRQTSGDVLLDGEPVVVRGTRSLRRYCRQVQLVFQDPFASLNPLRTVRYHLVDPLRIHHRDDGDLDERAGALLERVSLTPASRYLDQYPHELSGGQRQRVSIARALAVGPRVLLADEPVSMLDVSIRLGVLDLLAELQRDLRLGVLYITHDIASARHFADRVLVMYAGQVVESGTGEQVTQAPRHPYTRLLIDSAPDPEAAVGAAAGEGVLDQALDRSAEPPSLISPPAGCRFRPRCPLATEQCRLDPPVTDLGDGRQVRCWGYVADTPAGTRPDVSSMGAAA